MDVFFAVYSTSSGEIISTGRCPENMAAQQAVYENTATYIGSVNERAQKIDLETLLPVDKTEAELLAWDYAQIEYQMPDLSDINDIDDTTLNSRIEEFYLGQVVAATWRIENYVSLRSAAYPDYKGVYLDAMVKMSSTDTDMQTEGSLQLQQYYTDCLAVKERFPKEST